jgi:hypothetical protein
MLIETSSQIEIPIIAFMFLCLSPRSIALSINILSVCSRVARSLTLLTRTRTTLELEADFDVIVAASSSSSFSIVPSVSLSSKIYV